MKRFFIILLCLNTHNSFAFEPLTIVPHTAHTSSINRYLSDSNDIDDTSRSVKQRNYTLPIAFPIQTKTMRPGKVMIQAKNMGYLSRPMFLIGSDKFSLDWLQARRTALLKLDAFGWLVQANTIHDVERVLRSANGLRIVPASVEQIAQEHGLTHYPVLISSDGWEQ